ncbi:hypothetical protein [Brachyspira hyodysenteriae]|uniref:hypothetical protein n=1 Tax=Brachyspira hyodysenteriae TaxID=159 RepID=UPI0022CD4CF2|nr:hypothetical protein [Brachyspira hyodysenteriae]MDA0020174.1 hypothetical protein [Brachyspira hyodysenteriae]
MSPINEGFFLKKIILLISSTIKIKNFNSENSWEKIGVLIGKKKKKKKKKGGGGKSQRGREKRRSRNQKPAGKKKNKTY